MINTSIGLVGVASQASKGVAATTPKFVHGLTGGKVFSFDRSIQSAKVSCGVRANTDSYVESIVPGLDFETYGYSDVLPLYFYAALGSIASTAATPSGHTKHIVTLGDKIPYLTFWGRIGDEYSKTSGCKLDKLEMEFEGNKPLSFGLTLIGMGAEMGLTAFPGNVDPSCFDGYFSPTGGTFKLDTASGTPADAAVLSGSLSISNACETDTLAGKITPGGVSEGKITPSGKIKVKPDDMSLYRAVVTGSPTGTAPTGDMVYGSFSWTFKHSKKTSHSLVIEGKHVPFTADYPEVAPDGGAAEIEFSFADIGIEAKSDSPVTVTITNETASYTS